MAYEPLWKYCGRENVNSFLLSLKLFDGIAVPPERQLACLYALSRHAERHYRPVKLQKRDGSSRKILSPDPLLKGIQRNILMHLLSGVRISQYATAYKRGCSILQNAMPHTASPLIVKLDIEDFFPSVSYPMIYAAAFHPTLFPPQTRALLTNLCCYLDALPQGAPTSPAISNIIMRPFDEHMGKWCADCGITYTRYSDDMTFSGDFSPNALIGKAGGFLSAMGFTLNERKTRVIRPGRRLMVTGIVINKFPQVSREYRKKLKQELYYTERYGIASHLSKLQNCDQSQIMREDTARYLRVLAGKIRHVLSVNPNDLCFQKMLERLSSFRE